MTETVVCSVILPSYRSEHTIRATLQALHEQSFRLPHEIILVDSSDDATAAIVRREFPTVHLIQRSEQTDPATARNLGAQAARGRYVCFIDSDCVADRDWLQRLYDQLERGYHAVGGAIANGNGETAVSWAGYFCEFREFLPGGAAREVGNLTLGNAGYRREEFLALGGFPAGYFPQEDQVFHALMRERQQRILFDPAIIVYHSHRSDPALFLHHQRRIGQVNARVLQTLPLQGARFARDRRLAIIAMPALIIYRFIRTVLACRHVDRGRILRQPAILWLCWRGMIAWGGGFIAQSQPRTWFGKSTANQPKRRA